MTISAPFIIPLGLKPKPTQPVVLTVSLNVMSPFRSSKPHSRHTWWSRSRYTMKGMECCDATAPLGPARERQRKRSRERMMSLWSWKSSHWAQCLWTHKTPSLPPSSHTPPTHTWAVRWSQVIQASEVHSHFSAGLVQRWIQHTPTLDFCAEFRP